MLPQPPTLSDVALPRWLARLNVRFSNRLMRPIAARLPWFCVLEHVGRTSGTVRRTAMMAFYRDPDRWVMALTYGTNVQWLRNVIAAGGCRLHSRGRWVEVVDPRQFRDASRSSVPWIVRPMLTILRVADFVEMRETR
jgi:deazaflavin-dependent oxidoreductase (nitroreductase family)